MYLHVGNDVVVHHPDVIGIFDLENTSVSKYTKEFLRTKQQDNRIIDVTQEIPKSFVVTCDKKGKEKDKKRTKKETAEAVSFLCVGIRMRCSATRCRRSSPWRR